MTESAHLSDLELDRLRLVEEPASGSAARAHLSECQACQRRLMDMRQMADNLRPDLSAALSRAEHAAAQGRSGPTKRWIPVVAIAATAGLMILLLVRITGTDPVGQDTVRIKGAPRLEVFAGDGTPVGVELFTGQRIRVRLSGHPPARIMLQKDQDGSWKALWPRENESWPGIQPVELDLEVERKSESFKLAVLFGPHALSRKLAQKWIRSLEKTGAGPPEGWVAKMHEFRVVNRP